MKVTAQDLAELGVIDRIVKEPIGGAHRDPAVTAEALGDALSQELEALSGKSAKQLRRLREDRFLGIGDHRRSRGRRSAGA
jgi:acetyl-CoA carboxylase carboxyl transferase subunit alpha